MKSVLVALAVVSAGRAYATMPSLVGTLNITQPAFLGLVPGLSSGNSQTLLISQFTGNPLAKDKISAVLDVNKYASTDTWSHAPVTELTDEITWPNTNSAPSAGQLGDSFSGFISSGGFLVPPKCVGAVSAVSVPAGGSLGDGSATVTTISAPKGTALSGGWFYHMSLPLDVDGDGLEDIVTARAIKPIFGASGGELVWLKRPSGQDPLAPSVLPW